MVRDFWKNYKKIFLCLLIAVVSASLFIFFMDFDLLRELYRFYYGDSEVAQFFDDWGTNVFENSIRITSFKLVIFRMIYSMLPIAVAVFLIIYYHQKQLPGRLAKLQVFEKNKDLPKILQIGRYLLAFGIAFLILNIKRDYYYSTFHNCLMGRGLDYVRIILACLVFFLGVSDLKRFWEDLRSFPKRHRHLTMFAFILFISVASCSIMEFQIGSKMQVFPFLLHINIMYWLLLQLFILALTRNPKVGAFISLILGFAIGLANDIVFQFRGNYIMYGDLTVVRTAMEVAENYEYKPGFWFWLSLAILILMIAFVIFVKLPTRKRLGEPKKKWTGKRIGIRIGTTVLYEALMVLFVVITFRNGSFYGRVFGVGWDYNENVTRVGYLPYFFSNMDSTVRINVEGYSAGAVKELMEEEKERQKSETPEKTEVKSPNIIIVQNEAFSDLRITADIETDVDALSYIHSMKENTQKGFLNMSITGGPTANSEFEVLTRSSMQYLPYGAVPYTQYVKHNIPSIARVLKAQKTPYNTVAYHSYYTSGYNRNSVYDYLGFDKKVFEDNFFKDYPESDLLRLYLSDEANYRRVISLYEENEKTDSPFFCFNVTIQGHGGYGSEPYDLGEKVDVTNFEATEPLRTYLSNVKVSDTAFKGLVEYFEKVDEPTIIFMYGDHQPAFDDKTKDLLKEHPAWDDEDAETLSKFYVPYVLWANFDIEEYDYLLPADVKAKDTEKWHAEKMNTLSTNYVGSYVMEQAGVELSVYDKYLLDLHKEVPAMTAIGVWDKEGNYYPGAPYSPFAEQLHDLEKIQYNLVFDDEHLLNEYFIPQEE